MSDTIYKEQVVADYRDNPLIEALPPIWSTDEVIDMLSHSDGHHDKERQLDARYRMHCIQRLFHYFQPLEQHIDIEQRFAMCIRQGYLHRNPLGREYAAALAQGHDTLMAQNTFKDLGAFRPTAAGFSIIGMSGIGKTYAVSNILALYPQVIEHARYREFTLVLKQIVWLKLDCPYDGSVKGLCMSFFEAVDRVADTKYLESFGKRSATIDILLVRMAQVARLYCVGVLVIDEIQHLSLAKNGGSEKMLNFFVTLVNTIGVPIVLIGTSKAKPLLQSEFRQARRSSGHYGDLLWDRMKNDESWELFVLSMWENQWTRHIVPLTSDFKDALYHESQGITDIAVKLYAMAQIRAIGTKSETFQPRDFHAVVLEKFGLVRKALDALRSGDRKLIDAIGDIAPISVDDYYAAYLAGLPDPGAGAIQEKRDETSLSGQAVLKLLELDVEPALARRLVGKVMATNLNQRKVGDIVRLAYQSYLSPKRHDFDSGIENGDLRNSESYDDMKAAGVVDLPK
jgi:hypothetical protein